MPTVVKEWFTSAPWGHIALISWGNPAGQPVLLVHGRADSAVTFEPLLATLPEKYHYVGFDLPGHGKSDPFPKGVMVTRLHFVSAVEVVVRHLRWKRYVYLAHSMGSEIGLLYNAICPREITKFIHLDVGPAIQSIQRRPLHEFYRTFYAKYYETYSKGNNNDKVYSKSQAVASVMRARGMTQQQADLILSRNLTRVGEDAYKLSWDRRLQYLAPMNVSNEFYSQLFCRDAPPTLYIAARHSTPRYLEGKESAEQLIADLKKNINNFYVITVDGSHDVHFTNPGILSKDVCAFLEKDFGVKSKL